MQNEKFSLQQPSLIIIALCILISLFIFVAPLLTGKKNPSIQASVVRNMEQFNEMVQKYIERHKAPPKSIADLLKDAQDNRYNKTLFNPLIKNSGNIDDPQIIAHYNDHTAKELNERFDSVLYQGKVGYYTWDNKYIIYGHLENGTLLSTHGQILKFTNQ